MLTSTPLFGQSPQNSLPLSPEEKRRVLIQLLELRSCREQVATYDSYVQRDLEADVRDKALSTRELEVERKATALAEKERDLALDQAGYYKAAYEALKKKPGAGCWVARIFTLGIHRCN